MLGGVLVEIRRGVPDDAAALREVAIAAKRHWGYSGDWMARWAARYQMPADYIAASDVYVAHVGGRVVGFASLVTRDGAHELDNLWVVPGHIGTGLGRRLFGLVRARAVELGAVALDWEAEPGAAGFYEHMGGRTIGHVWTSSERWVPSMRLDLAPAPGRKR